MCKQRQNFENFKVCTRYADYVVSTILAQQSTLDEEFGKGIKTIVGISDGGDYVIDRNGRQVAPVTTLLKSITEEKSNV